MSAVAVPSQPLTAMDLFAGCGGLTEGLKQAGYRVLAAVECAPRAVMVYRLNHPDVCVYEQDICNVKGSEVLDDLNLERGQLDLLAGCPPCQGFSRMRRLNKKEAAKDPRNDLVHQYRRLVEELQPRALLFENVPGLARDERFTSLMQDLGRLGYCVQHEIRNAAHYGVPQRRRRLVMLATKGAEVPKLEAVSERRTVAQTLRDRLPEPGASGDPAHDVTEARSQKIRDVIRDIPPDGGSRRDLGDERQLDCHRRCNGFRDVYGRMRWDDVSPTITSGFTNPSKGRFLHPVQNRCITPREAALLQTFPPNYVFPAGVPKGAMAVMIGNAFPPEWARQHAAALAAALRPSAH